MKKKALILDIDGTLTNSKKEITPATREALIRLQEMGHIVALASGRPTGGLSAAVEALEMERFGGYIMSFNGACVINTATKEIVYANTLPDGIAQSMQDYAVANGLGVCIYDGNEVVCGNGRNSYLDYEARLNGFTMRDEPRFEPLMKKPQFKVLMAAEPEIAQRHVALLARQYEGQLSIYRSEPFFIEIMNRGISKAAAIEGMLGRIGVAREDVIACGDGHNDMSMIVYAGVGVAMGNAVKEIREAADYITLTNDEDGLLPVIERFILNA